MKNTQKSVTAGERTQKIEYTVNGNDGVNPLLKQYEGQSSEQEAYLEIDPEANSVEYSYNTEIGSGVPASVWHLQLIRVGGINPYITEQGLADLHADIEDKIARIIAGWSEEFDGSNWIGVLDDDASEALQDLECYIRETGQDTDRYDCDFTAIWDEEEKEQEINEYREAIRDAFEDAIYKSDLLQAVKSPTDLRMAVVDCTDYLSDDDIADLIACERKAEDLGQALADEWEANIKEKLEENEYNNIVVA